MNAVIFLCSLLLVFSDLAGDTYAVKTPKPDKPGGKKGPKKPRISTTSVRFGTAFLTEADEPGKVTKGLDKNEVEVIGLLGVPSSKLDAYQTELKSREYSVHKTKDGCLLAARGGKMEVSEPGILFTSRNGRCVYVATKCEGDIPAAEASMMGYAARRVRDQDADWVLFKKSSATDHVSISIADHLTETASQQGFIMIAKGKVHCELIDLDLPEPGVKLSKLTPKTGLNVPPWVWILIILLFPVIAGVTAISIIQAKAARRVRDTPRTL